MATEIHLLIVEDSEDDALLLLRELHKSGFEPVWKRVDTPEAMKGALSAHHWDIVISDFSMPCFSGLEALHMLKESGLDIPFIIVSGKIGEETAVEAMRSGANDYIIKGNLARLVPAIEREIADAEVRRKRRQAEDSLLESERRYRILLESVTDYIYTTLIENGRPVATTHGPGCTAVTGYSPEEYAADPGLWLRMVPEEDQAAVIEQANAALAGHALSSLEHRIIHKEGMICWIRNTPVPSHDMEGNLIAYDGIITDITKRKQYENELANAKDDWERTFNAIIDPIMILDKEYRIVKANKSLAEKLELTPMGIQSLACFSIIHQTSEPPAYCPYTQLLADGQAHSAEFNSPKLGGIFSSNVSPLFGPDGTLQGSICIARNMSDLKALEAQLFQAQKMEAIGQLAGGIAHDFNNILTVIIGYSNLIDMNMEQDNPQKANLSGVLAAADRAADLTRSLLTFSRKQIMDPHPADLNPIIRKIDKFLKRIIGEDIELKTKFLQEDMTVNVDSGQIEQVLMNLATNARDAMPNGGLLSLETRTVEIDDEYIKGRGYGEPGCYACISVSDSGLGMDEATCKKVFEPFFTTKEVGKGTGLGLSIVFGIISQHKGFIDVESEPGRGTTFRIFLPLIQSTVAEKHTFEEATLEKGVETILVADDDASLRDLTEKTLCMFGYTVITAVNGRDALARFKENKEKIALVIMDIIMPEMNGNDAFNEMKKLNPDLKSIFISGYTSDIIQKRGLIDRELAFVSKPLNLKQLLIKIRDVLEGKA